MRKTFFIITIFITFFGCSIKHDYIWQEYKIDPHRLTSQFNRENAHQLKIIKGKADESEIIIFQAGPHQFYSDYLELTNAMADQLMRELQKKGIKIVNSTEKSLEVKVVKTDFEAGMWMSAAILNVEVTLGGEKTKSFRVRNSSPNGVNGAFDGAVALTVIEIINDSEVAAYINN
ncbi:MAG: hypothetical protein JW927_11275 [Deltaproteobacteria bacterium]|nr:hypothetical protein [Deltaproteobacteria bacterium]